MPRDKKKRPLRKAKQLRLKRYTKAREDVQLHGDIETVPVGAVRNEVVDPISQGFQPLPGLIGMAVRNGYETPEEMKVKQVDELHHIATNREIEPHVRIAAIRTAVMADKDQWERDHPELAGKIKGDSQTQVNVINFEQTAAAVEEIEKRLGRRIGLPPVMQQIEDDVSRVLPEELIPPS